MWYARYWWFAKNKIQQSINALHKHGMVSGDPHRGNFIIKNGEVRIIDLSGKRASAQRKAKDRIDLERHYGIKNEIKDLGYYLLVYRKKCAILCGVWKETSSLKIPQLHVFTRQF